MSAKVWVLGDAVVDLLPESDGRLLPCPGGAPANVAVGIARLGGISGFIGRVGDDPFGALMQRMLLTEGVDITYLKQDEWHRTSTVLVDLNDQGERSFTFMVRPSADLFLETTDLPCWRHGEWLHLCSIALSAEPSRTSAFTAMTAIRHAGGFVSFDPNIREDLWQDEHLLRLCLRQALQLADVVKLSEEEWRLISGKTQNDQDTLRKYQQANAVYADEAAKLKNTRLKNVLMKGDLTPEVVNNMLFSKNKSEIKTLYNSVGRVGRAQMRNGIIGKAMEKSGGSPDQFLRQLNILQNQTGITFKGQDAAYLKGLKNYLQSTQQAAKAAVTTPTGQQTIPFIIGYGTAMNPATTGAAVSYGLLTRAYESEPFRNAMLRMASTPRGSTAFEKAMQQAQKAINALTQGAKSDALSE